MNALITYDDSIVFRSLSKDVQVYMDSLEINEDITVESSVPTGASDSEVGWFDC